LLLDLTAKRRAKKKAAGKGCVLVACIEANTFGVNISAREWIEKEINKIKYLRMW
jgi:hydroxymethylpyrimidine/phosphomethylpyrimidine kinase